MTQQAAPAQWAPIAETENRYEVSTIGEVRRVKRQSYNPKTAPHYTTNKVLLIKQKLERGYLRVPLYINGKCVCSSVHRLVAAAFIPNPDGKAEVNHIDGNPANNKVENLEWATRAENKLHSYRALGAKTHLEGKTGGLHPSATAVTAHRVSGELVGTYSSVVEAAAALGLNKKNITGNLIGHRKTTGGYVFTYTLPNRA